MKWLMNCSGLGAFLIEIFSGDTELISYIHPRFRISHWTYHRNILVILWVGDLKGRNVSRNAGLYLAAMLDKLSRVILKQRFLKQRRGTYHDIMTLRGKRLVGLPKTDEGVNLTQES